LTRFPSPVLLWTFTSQGRLSFVAPIIEEG
jgi:hypothetical protein